MVLAGYNSAMKRQPAITTRRMVLRPVRLRDEAAVRALAGSKRIADLCLWLLYERGEQSARRFIEDCRQAWATGRGAEFAIELRRSGRVVGLAGLHGLDLRHDSAELGFVVNERHWGNGYASEAAAVVLWFGFEKLKLNRIYARHLAGNAASARVLAHIGMKREGVLREFAQKPDGFEDAVISSILRREWEGIS